MEFLPNVKILRNNLLSNGYRITAFNFEYKNVLYVVVFEALDKNNTYKQNEIIYTSRLHFFCNDEQFNLYANAGGFNISVSELRKLFGIEPKENLGDLLSQFYSNFNSYVPSNKAALNNEQKLRSLQVINRVLDEENKIYCFCIKRNGVKNGKQLHRSPYNSEKTMILRPELYDEFKNDDTISFYYTDDNSKEKTDEQIITEFSSCRFL